MPKDLLSDEDKALFRAVTAQVAPLKKGRNKKAIREEGKAKAAHTQIIPNNHKISTEQLPKLFPPPPSPPIYLSDHYPEEVLAETSLSYCQHSIPKKRFAALQKGDIPWQRRLDLHGLTPEQASERLLHFIQDAFVQSERNLLIIHGKGGRQPEKAPILKNLVNHWLPQIPEVLAFHSAAPKDGGNGALYVLLKRHR